MRRTCLFLLPLLAVLIGCGQAQTLGGKDRPKRYTKIVSLSPSTTEILAGNGIPLVGRTSSCNYPESVKKVPVVGSVEPDYEALARIKPDLVVYDKALYGEAKVRKIEALGAKTFAYNPQTFVNFQQQCYELGSLTATETTLASYVDRVRNAAAAASGSGEGISLAIILPSKSGRPLIAGTKGFLGEIVRATGAKMIGPNADNFVPLESEMIVTQRPDAVIVAGKRDDFLADKTLTTLMPGEQVYGLEPDVVLRRGGRVDSLIRSIAKAAGLVAAQKQTGSPSKVAVP